VKLLIDPIGCAFQDTKATREIIGKPRISLSTMEFLHLFLTNSNTSKPVLDQLEASFNGNQKFKILRLTEDELVLYFDEVIPVSIGTFTADMELRHTEFWQK